MKKLVLLLFASVLLQVQVKADEGMWLPSLVAKLNIGEMQEMGFKLSAEDVYNINNSSLKDAIVQFGRGCTGEIISDQGLLLTNHHCGYGRIQRLSTVENDYLEDGFWSETLEDEIPAPGLTVRFLVRIEDVTKKINSKLSDEMSEGERSKKIRELYAEIKEEATADTHYNAVVRSFYEGNDFFLFVYETYRDIRLVGAPPSSIGNYGDDTDNWTWPRHTGDFSLFRVYASPDGKPADYSIENVPLKPRHHLPISLKGVQKGDFAMTMGYAGRTNRYLPSWGIEQRMESLYKTLIDVRGIKQDIWLKDMKGNSKIRLQYSSKYRESSNYWKYSIGMNRGLAKLNVLDKKEAIEKEFAEWVAKCPERKAKYGNILPMLENAYNKNKPYNIAQNYLRECLIRGTEILDFADGAADIAEKLSGENVDPEELGKEINSFIDFSKRFFKNYSPSTDRKVFAALTEYYRKNVDPKFHVKSFELVDKKFKGDYKKFADYIYGKSIFASQEKLAEALPKISYKKLVNDPAFAMAKQVFDVSSFIAGEKEKYDDAIAKNNRLFIAGLREMNKGRVFYPDANGTMRLSYGKVGDYNPKDGVLYLHYTTLDGLVEKYIPGDYEFDVPQKLLDLYEAKDYGQYVDKDGTLRVCFTTNNDITGGNSGSPVINANGELFGLAFDGNWEAMSGDIAFEPELQKCINADIRYVLFVIDKFAGATRLIDEMTIVR